MEVKSKKSFLLYFDALESIRQLPYDQVGQLLLALIQYAQAASEEAWDQTAVLAQFPDMNDAARMAFSFMADAVRRDTEKWLAKHRRYRQAALVRAAERREREAADLDLW